MSMKKTKSVISRKAQKITFEIWRVTTPHSKTTKFQGYRCELEIITPPRDLSFACAKDYGGGKYVAFQLSESLEGFPLSHWVIEVKSAEIHRALRVFPDAQYLDRIRESTDSHFTDLWGV